MKAKDCADYDSNLPENFDWRLDNPKLCGITSMIAARIAHSFRTDPNRQEIPGLRAALNVIAEVAEIWG